MAAEQNPRRKILPRLDLVRASSSTAVVLTLAVLVAGCMPTIRHDVKLDPALDNLAVQSPLPIRAAIYYSPEFTKFQYQRDFMSSVITVDLGTASVDLFDRVLRSSFKEVARIDAVPSGQFPQPGRFDVIVEPRIEAFHIRWALEGDSEHQSVTYQLRLYDQHGVPIGVRLVRGKAVGFKPKPFQTHDVQSSADLRDAAEKIPGALSDMWTAYQAKQAPKVGTRPIEPANFEVQARRAENPFQVTPEIRMPLTENGIVAISVTVTNKGVETAQLRDHDFLLMLPSGRTISAASKIAILQPFERRSRGSDAAAAMFGMAGLVGAMAESADQIERREALRKLLDERGFRDRTLRAGESVQATVFFVPAPDVQAFSTADLLVWLVDPDGRRTAFTRIMVADLAYQPSKRP